MSSNLATAFFRVTILTLAGIGVAVVSIGVGVLIWFFS